MQIEIIKIAPDYRARVQCLIDDASKIVQVPRPLPIRKYPPWLISIITLRDRKRTGPYLCPQGVKQLLQSIGEHPDEVTLHDLFQTADLNGDGKLHIGEFL